MTAVVLPETFLRCVKPEDRDKLKLGLTAKEFLAKGAAANEKALQRQIVSLLRLKGIEPLVPTYGKKTRMRSGWPDITFAIQSESQSHACVWEVKHGDRAKENSNRQDEDHQRRMAIRLSSPPNGWRHRVIRSVDEALAELKSMGIE